MFPIMWLRDMAKKNEVTNVQAKEFHHRNNVGQMFEHETFCLPKKSPTGNLFSITLALARCTSRFGNHFTATCGNLFVTSVQLLC